jgi:hypothetical protein
VNASHEADVVTLQPHSRGTVMESEPVPPAGPNEGDEFATLAWQRTLEGLVTLVFAELPHAEASAAARKMLNSRARTTQHSTPERIA